MKAVINLKVLKKLVTFGHDDNFLAQIHGTTRKKWNEYLEAHVELAKNIQLWREKAGHNQKVIRKLYERACGYEYTETTVEKTGSWAVVMYGEDIRYEPEYRKKVVMKHMPADVKAIQYWLNNKAEEFSGTGTDPVIEDTSYANRLQLANQRRLRITDGAAPVDSRTPEEVVSQELFGE